MNAVVQKKSEIIIIQEPEVLNQTLVLLSVELTDDKSIGESSAGEHQSVHPIRRQTASSLLQVVVQES